MAGNKISGTARHNFKNILGNKYGKLLVIELAEIKNRMAMWLCLCDCGNKVVVQGRNLRNNNTKSCSCLQKEFVTKTFRKEPGFGTWNRKFTDYKRKCKKANRTFEITLEQYKNMASKNCYYCDAPPHCINYEKNNKDMTKEGKDRQTIFSNGIDRIDSNLGYLENNIRPCCAQCNYAKRNLSEADFYSMITKIYKLRIE
jgi:hypothetical protein